MDSHKTRRAQQELGSLDNALREVRGVGLEPHQKLEEGMMGGSLAERNARPEPVSHGTGVASLVAGSPLPRAGGGRSRDAFQGGLTGLGGSDQFKLPTIARGSQDYQAQMAGAHEGASPMHTGSYPVNPILLSSAAAQHHHLNVTLGDEKFYYTPANPENPNASRLPNITSQSGSSSRLRTHLGTEYIGLMTKKNKGKLGHLDYNVQNSFAHGGAAFNIQDARAEAEGDLPRGTSGEMAMATIEPVALARLSGAQDSERRSIGSRGSRGNNGQGHRHSGSVGGRNHQGMINTLQTNANDFEARKYGDAALTIQQPTSFESYIGKVITSVQHRKNNPRLKSLFNHGSHQNSLEYYGANSDPLGDYGSANRDAITDSQYAANSIMNQQPQFGQQATNQQMLQKYEEQAASMKDSQIARVAKRKQSRDKHTSRNMYDKNSANTGPETQTTQVSLLGNRNIAQIEPKATEQVAYLLRQIQKRGQIFLPLETVKDKHSSIMFKENKNPPENNAGTVVFSKNGFVSVAKDKNAMTDFISNDQYIEDGVTNQILKEIPFFKKFQSMRFFKQWKTIMRRNAYERKRQKLAENYIFSKPVFSEKYRKLIPAMNSISNLSLIEIQPNITYGKKQQSTLEDKCKTVLDENRQALEGQLTAVKGFMIELKDEILADDDRFEDDIKQARVQEMVRNKHGTQLVMFHKQRVKKEAIDEQYRLKRLRHTQYDELLFMVFRYWSAKIVELLFDSKKRFYTIFSNLKNMTQFEVSICFGAEGSANQGRLDSEPTMEEHRATFKQVFEDMERAVFHNQTLQFLMHDMNDLFFGKSSMFTRSIFENMQKVIKMNTEYNENHAKIFDSLERDVQRCQSTIDSYKHLQEVHDFCRDWTRGRADGQISLEGGFYQETWLKMGEFTEMIAKVPGGTTRAGTLSIETNTLKKQLTEMPRRVMEAIRHNVTQTMEQETKTLREELGKTSEILDQLPTSLNTYVEQVNTLKYVNHKREEFEAKFVTINKQSKQENIKVSPQLLRDIEEVRTLHTNLPKLEQTSREQLAQNKDTMEKIMKSSSTVLSKKIKAFEKKYVETYLHDESRLDDCGDTLEELFKRSKAIHEIRSKVILYREFLKLLYENEEKPEEKMAQNKLSCAEDFENLQEIHKHSIRLWKILLYWKKRRQMCYNTPFLNLDTQMIIKSIHKVMKYLDDKLPQHEFVQRQSRRISKKIYQQVHETNLIIEFVKDLRKDSLQNRHWMQIFDLIKAPHLKTQNKFTIVELREYNIQNYKEDIHHIIEHANTEAKYETIFKCICEEWEKLELKIIPFKDTQNSYIMVNTETLNQAIEENLNTLEVISQSEFATHIKKDILAWILKLKTMHKNLEIWIDAQRYWVNLDIIYNSAIFADIFGESTKQFINTRLQFQRIMWSSYKNPKAIYNLMIDSRIKVFKEMTKHFQVLQKKVHEFLEEKRLVFSRFFFLNDSQFLEFLTLANTSQDFSMYINTLFVGAQNLYIQPADQVKLQKHEDGGEEGAQHSDQISEEEDSILSGDEDSVNEKKSALAGQQSVENSKMGIEGVNEYQVLGMISQNKELFLFESPVLIENDNKAIKEVEGYEVSGTGTGNVEQWLIKVEKSMQETMQKQMQYAVKSFATRALDEWVLDYPQQVIMTTLNLVLTNEVNDILDQRQRQKEQEDAEGSDDNENQDEDDAIVEEAGDDDQDANKDEAGRDDRSKNASGAGNDAQRDSAIKEGGDENANATEKKTLKGTAQLKLSAEEQKRRLQTDLFGDDFKPDERFTKAIDQAIEDVRQRRIAAQATAGAGGAAAAAAKAAKRNQKRPGYKDHVMEVLGQQSFYGIFLRIQFWINKIIRSLNDERKSDWQDKTIDFSLTGVQKMVMRNVILFLIHQRDSIDKMITLDIHDKNDFEWLSKVKVSWNEPGNGVGAVSQEGPVVQCGGWQQSLGTEYLGSQQRIPLSPLTDRYYVFISSALREKSGVLFRCNQSHQHASDVFEEFSHQCHMPYKSFQCNQDMNVSQLMQVINGAAMARFWVFFEHLDNLPLVNFQIVIKEIQMVQQQYIIAELGDYDLTSNGNTIGKGIHLNENKADAKEDLAFQKDQAETIVDHARRKPQLPDQGSLIPTSQVALQLPGITRPSLGIFGSLSSHIIIKNPEIAENLNLQAQSTFRTVSLAKPDVRVVIKMLLKSEGYHHYDKLSRITTEFISEFISKKNEILYGREAANSAHIDQITEKLVVRDLRIAVRFSILLRDQEWTGYREKIFSRQEKRWKFELQLYEKTLTQKQEELVVLEQQKQQILKDKENIEIDTMREGFRNILKTKFFNEWRAVKQQQLSTKKGTSEEKIDEGEAEKELEALILDTYNLIRENIRQEEEEVAKEEKKNAAPDPLGSGTRQSISNKKGAKTARLIHSSTTELNFASKRQKDEQDFMSRIGAAFDEVVEAMKLSVSERQLYHCLGVIECMRRQKAVAIVGPVCSGKTQILKIVSQTLQRAYGIIFRTSAVNPQTFTKEEFYGPINAFESQNQQDQDEALKKKSIFQIVLDNYQHEKLSLKPDERNRFVQSFLIDSDQIDQYFMDSLIQFLQKSNIREREYFNDQEFLLHLSSLGQAHDTLIQHLPINLPNGNVIMLPSDLYFFFETDDLSNASPLFLSQIGLVITQDSDVRWEHLFDKNRSIYFIKHQRLASERPHHLQIQEHFAACERDFLVPMIRKLDANEKIADWSLWNVKSLVLQFFKILNSMTHRLHQACDRNLGNEDPMLFPIEEMKRDTIWSTILCSFVMTFGVCLNNELQKIFEEIVTPYKKQFNIHPNSQAVSRPTIFEIYFDVDRLSWEVIQEKLEYKLKLGYYPKMSALLVPTPSIALSYFIMEQLTFYLKFDGELNKNFRVLGPQGTSKSVILNTFIHRSQDQFDSIMVPMSCYLSFDRLRKVVERQYVAKRKKIFTPKNEAKKVVIMIDDLHLQSNLKINVVEFMRTWCQSNGYFDVGAGFFKRITDFSIIMAQNSSYRVDKCKLDGRQPLKNRFLFYTNTQYSDEMPIERYRSFIQHWLTSKMWTPNKLLQKYYIIITNGLIRLLERVQSTESMNNSSFSPLFSFDILAKFCSSLVMNTVISDDPREIGLKDQREEDAIANVVLYEVFRNYADRIYKPQDRLLFAQQAVEIFRHEFQMKDAKVEYIDQMIIGNFHERQTSSYSKFVNNTDKKERVKDMIIQKIAEKSNNHFLASILDTPNGIRDVFKLSRILFKEQQHLILCGSASSSKHECLQIATILNDVVMTELNAPKFNEPSKFAEAFKQALLNVIRLDETNCYIVINDEQLRDPLYIDFVYNYITNIGKDEECILMDEEFKANITNVEVELFMKNKENFKYDKNKKPNLDACLKNGVKKLMKHAHIVFMINDLQTYHEWFSLFPGLETKCDVMFVDDLNAKGYHSLTRTFLERSKIDEDMEEDEKTNLVKSIVQAKEIVKSKIFENFYTQKALKNYVCDDYLNGQGAETVYPNEKKAHFNMFEDGNFKVYDPLLKQVNYNLRAELNVVMKARFLMYLEVFRFLFDFLSLNLSIRKNYYETFINKTRQFNSFFDEIKSKKKDLHLASNNINYKMTMIQDKINKINKSVQDKRMTITSRKAEIDDLELQLKNQRDEVDQVLKDKNAALDEVLDDFGRLGERDVAQAVSVTEPPKSEQALLDIIAMIIDKRETTLVYDKDLHAGYFLEPAAFGGVLNDRREFEFNDACFRRLKEFIVKSQPSEYSKPAIFKVLYAYLSELYRKLNVRNTMSQQFNQIAEIKASIDSNYFSINYSEQYIKDKQQELQILNEKIKRVTQRDNKLSKKVEVAEISHMRTQHIFDSVKEYGQKVKLKLDRINSRLQALLGDCIVLAASICLLGFFSSDERIEIRHEIVKFVSEVQDINCSKDWTIDGKNPNPKVQNKMFKSILKEYGLRHILLPHKYSGVLTESTICEALFHMIFAPSCPLIIDPTGEVQEYIRSQLISELHVKRIYGSDLNINSQIQSIFKSQGSFGLLNDVNNFEKASFGLSQDQSLLHRLGETFYNGIDFHYERSVLWKKVPGIEDHIFSSFNCLNKKMPVNEPNLDNVSLYQVQMFSPGFDYQNGSLFMAKGSCFVAMSSNEDIFHNSLGVNAWMELKELMLEQINPHEWKQLQEVKEQIKFYDENKSQLSRAYENNFLVANHDTLQRIEEYTNLKQSIEDIESQSEERVLYKRLYEEMIQKYEILTYYAKVILNMFLSLKVLSKVMNEVTYSWRMFKQILQQILKQAIRNLAQEAANAGQKKTTASSKGTAKPEVDIDLKFFQKNLIPKLHKTLVTSICQDSSAPLFNLILSMRVALLQDKITSNENTFFFKQLLLLKDFQDWRKTERDFVNMEEEIPRTRLLQIKRDLSRLYPDFGKQFVERLEADLGPSFRYQDASLHLFKLFKDVSFKNLSLIQEICLGFLCPDHEFKSKLTQFVYLQLSEVFDFSEEYSKLHQFLSRASWKSPIALLSVSHVNMINTISSVAQHYGVGLDVLRTDQDSDELVFEQRRGINIRVDTVIKANLLDHTAVCMQSKEQRYQKLQTLATSFLKEGNICSDIQAPICKLNYIQNSLRQQFDNPDKKLSGGRQEDPVQLIERSARLGSWVLVSTIRFPQFWKKVCDKLEELADAGLIDDKFRIIFDLQGYAQNDISDSFLFNHAVSFHMTEQNMEEFEGFDDIWSTILDERVLIKLEEKIEAMKATILEEQKPKAKEAAEEDSKSDELSESGSSARRGGVEEPESPSNFKLIDSTIKSEVQKSLYKQFMHESKADNQGLKFDLMRAQQPSEASASQDGQAEDLSANQHGDRPSATSRQHQLHSHEDSPFSPPSLPTDGDQDKNLNTTGHKGPDIMHLNEAGRQGSPHGLSAQPPHEVPTSKPGRTGDEEDELNVGRSQETGNTHIDNIRVDAAITRNEEEFKEINETLPQTSEAMQDQSFRDNPVKLPHLELPPASQSHSQALLKNSASSLNREATQQLPPASALENAFGSKEEEKRSTGTPEAAFDAGSKTTPAQFDSQKILNAIDEAEAAEGARLAESSLLGDDLAGAANDDQEDLDNKEGVQEANSAEDLLEDQQDPENDELPELDDNFNDLDLPIVDDEAAAEDEEQEAAELTQQEEDNQNDA